MNPLLRKLLEPRQTQYLVVNHHFIIQETSAEVQHYADTPDDAIPGADARMSFPELIGIENTLMSIIMGRLPSFDLKGIARFTDHNALYTLICWLSNMKTNKKMCQVNC
jgi:hypothetical protein